MSRSYARARLAALQWQATGRRPSCRCAAEELLATPGAPIQSAGANPAADVEQARSTHAFFDGAGPLSYSEDQCPSICS